MRVLIHTRPSGDPASANFATAAYGFAEMGWETVYYTRLDDVLEMLEPMDVVVDFVDPSRRALAHLGITIQETHTYPESLRPFLGRRIWQSTINQVAAAPEDWPVFVKPQADLKKFTGVLVRSTRDLVGCGDQFENTPVWCSEPVHMVREWRCFLRYGEILDVRPYKGDWRVAFDAERIAAATEAWSEQPAGCALDFAVDEQGRTLVVEANDGFALGAYGLFPVDYARLLSARWSELTGTPDPCRF